MSETLSIPEEPWVKLRDTLSYLSEGVERLMVATTLDDLVATAAYLSVQCLQRVQGLLDRVSDDSPVFERYFGHDGAAYWSDFTQSLDCLSRLEQWSDDDIVRYRRIVWESYQGLSAAVGSTEFVVSGQSFHGSRFDLTALVSDHQAMFEKTLETAGGIGLNVDLGSSEPVFAHRDTVLTLILNMIDNAPQHGDAQQVWMSTEQHNGHSRLIVEDDGDGVADDARDRIFHVKPIVSTSKGSGLGLAFAPQRMQYNGGDLTYEARGGVNGGAKFVLEMPVHRGS